MLTEIVEYLKYYIPPKELLSVSIFEDKHPNTDKGINAVVTHLAGPNPRMQQIVEYEVEMMFVPEEWEWEHLFRDANDYMNEKGPGWSHKIASCNQTVELSSPLIKEDEKKYDESALVLVLSWQDERSKHKEIVTPNGTKIVNGLRFENSEKGSCGCNDQGCSIF